MLSHFGDVNWLAVIVCTVIGMIIGFLWYGPLFGKPWGAITGWTSEKVAALPKGKWYFSYALAIIAAFIIASVLAVTLLATGSDSIGDGVIAAIILWVGFTGATIGINMTFERRPLSLYGIEAGHHLVAIVLYAIVLSIW